jgi:hypothetical protein
MKRFVVAVVLSLGAFCASLLGADYKFTSTWKAPDIGALNFAGKKVAALIFTTDDNLRISAEEALAREITARGPQGVPAYRLIPREEAQDPNRAKSWFERSNVDGVVALRVVDVAKQTSSSVPMIWTAPYYSDFWSFYSYGWTTVYQFGGAKQDVVLSVETLLYDVKQAKLLWAGVSETTNPKEAQIFITGLVGAVVKELQKQGLIRK